MDRTSVDRQQLIEVVNDLPDEFLLELSIFLDYLHYKSSQHNRFTNIPSSFLMAVAGLGNSGHQDISDHDEEILSNEIHPVYGWHSKQRNLNDRDT